MKLLVATSNRGKLDEFSDLLPDDVELLSLADVGLPPPDETGDTFRENARIKAGSAVQAGFPVLAEDAGLEVDALDGAPGVFSARYAGPDATDAENNALLLAQLGSLPREERRARFRSVVVLLLPDGREFIADGVVGGVIVEAPRGTKGFGYDPLFEIDDRGTREYNGLTAAELTREGKNAVSHRARAYRALLQQIRREAAADPALEPFLDTADEE